MRYVCSQKCMQNYWGMRSDAQLKTKVFQSLRWKTFIFVAQPEYIISADTVESCEGYYVPYGNFVFSIFVSRIYLLRGSEYFCDVFYLTLRLILKM